MTDSTFEQSLARQLRAYAEGGVRPVDRYAIAEELIQSDVHRRRYRWYPASGRWVASPSIAIIVIALVLALLAAVVVGGLVLRMQLSTSTPGRNGLIAFAMSDGPGGAPQVHLMNPDGSGDRALAPGSDPIYSADGETLVFDGLDAEGSDPRIMVADGDSANIRGVVEYQRGEHQVSPDGTQLAVNRDVSRHDWSGRGGIWLVQLADGSSHLLVPPPEDSTLYSHIRWSPDGKSIAYAVQTILSTSGTSGAYRSSIAIVDVATGDIRTVTNRAGTDNVHIAWAPDSERLAFTGLRDDSPMPSHDDGLQSFYPPEDLFVVNADGTDEQNVSNSLDTEWSPGWNPNGTEISYLSWNEGSARLVIDRIDGTVAARRSRVASLADSYWWSPDGELILVVTTEDLTPTDPEDQLVHTTMQTLDAAVLDDPVTIAEHDFGFGGVSWQWLKP